jgi:hypothetical protein
MEKIPQKGSVRNFPIGSWAWKFEMSRPGWNKYRKSLQGYQVKGSILIEGIFSSWKNDLWWCDIYGGSPLISAEAMFYQ